MLPISHRAPWLISHWINKMLSWVSFFLPSSFPLPSFFFYFTPSPTHLCDFKSSLMPRPFKKNEHRDWILIIISWGNFSACQEILDIYSSHQRQALPTLSVSYLSHIAPLPQLLFSIHSRWCSLLDQDCWNNNDLKVFTCSMASLMVILRIWLSMGLFWLCILNCKPTPFYILLMLILKLNIKLHQIYVSYDDFGNLTQWICM